MDLLLCQVDRPSVTEQQCNEVQSNLFDLFAHLGATDDQLDFTTLYASAREVYNTPALGYLQSDLGFLHAPCCCLVVSCRLPMPLQT